MQEFSLGLLESEVHAVTDQEAAARPKRDSDFVLHGLEDFSVDLEVTHDRSLRGWRLADFTVADSS